MLMRLSILLFFSFIMQNVCAQSPDSISIYDYSSDSSRWVLIMKQDGHFTLRAYHHKEYYYAVISGETLMSGDSVRFITDTTDDRSKAAILNEPFYDRTSKDIVSGRSFLMWNNIFIPGHDIINAKKKKLQGVYSRGILQEPPYWFINLKSGKRFDISLVFEKLKKQNGSWRLQNDKLVLTATGKRTFLDELCPAAEMYIYGPYLVSKREDKGSFYELENGTRYLYFTKTN